MNIQGKLRDLPKGITRTTSGHLRYTSPVSIRGEYVHRAVYNKCLEDTPYSIRLLLPNPFEVHHMDYNKEHNCPNNLMGIDIALHSVQTADGRRRHPSGKFAPRWKPAVMATTTR